MRSTLLPALAALALLVLSGCAGGDPLPRPSGPREPLNGWVPQPPAEQAEAAQ
jgi:hypothetical protein